MSTLCGNGVKNGLPKVNLPQSCIIEYECQLKKHALPNITHYSAIGTLEQIVDDQSVVVEETLLVECHHFPAYKYNLRIVELRDIKTLRAILHELEMLKTVGLHKNVMSLFSGFRHRQYIGLLQPPFSSLRDRLNVLYRLKNSDDSNSLVFHDRELSSEWQVDIAQSREVTFRQQIGLANRGAVAYILRDVLQGLEYIHSKGFVHTQIASSSVFMNDSLGVKLGGLLHAKGIGSMDWTFTSGSSRLPPEAFLQSNASCSQLVIQPNFDTWSIGMLTIELITGLQTHSSTREMRKIANEYFSGVRRPPTLGDADSSTLVNGKQVYHSDIDGFLAESLLVDPAKRVAPSKLLQHPFLSQPIDSEAARRHWNVSIPRPDIDWNTGRSLRVEMLTSHTAVAELKPELLHIICKAAKLADNDFFPIFQKPSKRAFLEGFIAIEVSLAVEQLESEEHWSKAVLDISAASSQEYMAGTRAHNKEGPTRERISSTEAGDPFAITQHLSSQTKNYQRVDMVFFIAKGWSEEQRRIFIALQFARWHCRNLICFADLVRVVDELDDVYIGYVLEREKQSSPYKLKVAPTSTAPPASVSFISGLRKSLQEPTESVDPLTRKFNHIYVDVALSGRTIAEKKTRFDDLSRDDPVELPADKTFHSVSVTFCQLNIPHLETLEAVMLGQERVQNWEYQAEQRLGDMDDPHIELTYLLQERRRNPNSKIDSEIDWETSNQARAAKLWGDYDRDFLFRFCKYSVPHKIEETDIETLFGGSPRYSAADKESHKQTFELSELEKQLLRTRIKQEEDAVDPLKRHDNVEERRVALALRFGNRNAEQYSELNGLDDFNTQMQQILDSAGNSPPMTPKPARRVHRLPPK